MLQSSSVSYFSALWLVFAVYYANVLLADNERQELAALVKDFSTAWNCVRTSLVDYGQLARFYIMVFSRSCISCIDMK